MTTIPYETWKRAADSLHENMARFERPATLTLTCYLPTSNGLLVAKQVPTTWIKTSHGFAYIGLIEQLP